MPQAGGPSRGPTVLVADDSRTVRAVITAALEAGGYCVLEAEDGRTALAAVHAQPVDLVLLDIEMPELDGWGVVSQLKADPATADVAVVFLTGRASADDAVHALRLGAQDFVRKPPQPDELLARVAAALRTKQLHDALRSRVDRLEVRGRTDALTGLRNRRHAEQHLDAALRAGAHDDRDLSVLLLDIDRFKAVNDERGHAVGDQVLRDVADRLRATVRADDLVSRWGGEEFLVVSRSSGTGSGLLLAERLRRTVQEPPLRPVAGAPAVTVSVGGVFGRCPPDTSAEALLAVADRNLYLAKAAGRDRVVVTRAGDVGPAAGA